MVHLTGEQTRLLSLIFEVLAEQQSERAVRVRLGELLSRLLRADCYASYIWNEASQSFKDRVALNMSDGNLARYEAYYQFHDPITHKLRACSGPTLVTQVLPQKELLKTEFFNDFLRLDGLHWGVNLHVRVEGECTGDLRIWRGRRGENFDRDELALLEMIAPAFRAALRRCIQEDGAERSAAAFSGGDAKLSAREAEIARLAAHGFSDKEIAGQLNISFTTVRTHLKNAFRKLRVDNRVKLATRFR